MVSCVLSWQCLTWVVSSATHARSPPHPAFALGPDLCAKVQPLPILSTESTERTERTQRTERTERSTLRPLHALPAFMTSRVTSVWRTTRPAAMRRSWSPDGATSIPALDNLT